MIERLTLCVLKEWRDASKGRAISRVVAGGHHDRKVMASVMRMNERPAGANATTEGHEAHTEGWPTGGGMAIRLRADDMGLGKKCELCHAPEIDGGHVYHCRTMGRKAREAAWEETTTALRAAAEAIPRTAKATIPENATAEAWTGASRAAGACGAVAALGTRASTATTEAKNAHEWAAGGWRRQDETYTLSNKEGSTDIPMIAWCAMAIRQASEEAARQAEAAAEAEGAAPEVGRAEAEKMTLHEAGEAIGAVTMDEEIR